MLNYFKESVVWLNILTFWSPWSFFVCILSHVSCVWLFATQCTVACQASLSMGFSRQEYWNGLPSQQKIAQPTLSLYSGKHFSDGGNLFILVSMIWTGQVFLNHQIWVPFSLLYFTISSKRKLAISTFY